MKDEKTLTVAETPLTDAEVKERLAKMGEPSWLRLIRYYTPDGR